MKKCTLNLIKLLSLLILTGLLFTCLQAQKTKPAKKSQKQEPTAEIKFSQPQSIENTVVATVGNEMITYSDLEKAFKKNMNRREINLYKVSPDSLRDFINLYTNYRLKVMDALGRGFDKDSAVVADIAQNRRILAESYFYERRMVEPKVDQLLKLRERELQFSFMLFKFPPLPSTDTAQTHRKAITCLDMLKAGKDFISLARDSSEERESAQRGGLVQNFVTGGKLQRSIEDALYSVKPGEVVPELVRFRDGYLILRLLKNEPRILVKARHILVTGSMEKDSLRIVRKADSLIRLLKEGKDFIKLAEENSDDPGTAIKGGDIGGWYSRSTGLEGSGKPLPTSFETTIFELKDGGFSDKVFSDFGIHIIKRDSSKPVDLAAEKDEIKKLYKRLYYETDKKAALDSLKKVFGFQVDAAGMKKFISALDTNKTTLDSAWTRNITPETNRTTLFSFNKKQINIGEFTEILKSKNEFRGTATNEDGIKRAIDKYLDPKTFDLATTNIDSEFPDFAMLMKEFRDGILLFRVEALEVWDKLKFDSVLARVYWDSTKHRYFTQPTYEFNEIFTLNDTIAREIIKKANEGEDFEKLAEGNTQRANYREKKGYWGKVTTKDNQLARLIHERKPNPGVLPEPVKFENGWSVIKIIKYEPPRQKTFEEAISDFAPDFQDLMQKSLVSKWLGSVKQKYPVNIDTEALNRVITQLKNK